MTNPIPPNQSWLIVTFNRPVQWTRGHNETWLFNPNRRYILSANQLSNLHEHVESISPLTGSRHLRRLDSGSRIHDAKILVDRYRDRGIGDLLFLSGALSYLHDMSGATARLDVYGLSDRAEVLTNHPALAYGPLVGPVHYDDLPNYTYHWFIEHVSEHAQEPDQPNVYDVLYREIGVDPAHVLPKYKRPVMRFTQDDLKGLDRMYATIYHLSGHDLRTKPYVVVAPTAVSPLRTAPYRLWLDVIAELAKKVHVVVVGNTAAGQVPSADMAFGDFSREVDELVNASGRRVVSLMGSTPLRPVAGLIANSLCALTLDSGLLYVAQAVRAPAVSLWGTHAPHVRLGYDKVYMDLAIWARQECPAAPCFAHSAWPTSRCPQGEAQRVCAPLAGVTVDQVMAKVELAERLPR